MAKVTFNEDASAIEPLEDTDFVDTALGLGKQVVGGARDAVVEAGQFALEPIKDLGDFIRDEFPAIKSLDPGDQFTASLPEVAPPEGLAQEIVRSGSQFLTAFVPFFKAAKGFGVVTRGMVAGAQADIVAFDPDDPLIADAITNAHPELRGPLVDLMRSDPDDPDALKRFKRAIEGLALGAIGDGIFRVGKAIVASRRAKRAKGPDVSDEQRLALAAEREVAPEQAVSDPALAKEITQQQEAIDFHREAGNVAKVERGEKNLLELKARADVLVPEEKFAGSVNLARIEGDSGLKQAIVDAADLIKREPTLTDDQVIAGAATSGFDLQSIEQFATATTKQRTQFLATRNVGVNLAQQYEVARKAYVLDPSPANFTSLKEAESLHLRGFKAMNQAASNAGFALHTFRIQATGEVGAQEIDRTINKLLEIVDGKGKLSDEVTLRLATLDKSNPEEVASFVHLLSTKGATISDKIFEGWLSGILSGPLTHAANIIGNTATHVIRPAERFAAATVELFAAPIAGRQRERLFGEVALDIWGMAGSLPDAGRAMARTFRTGITTGRAKIEISDRLSKIEGKTGTVIRAPLRALSAMDEFFKAFGRGGDLLARSYRIGVQQGKRGSELWDHIQADRLFPNEELRAALNHEAAYRTFTRNLGSIGQTSIHLRNLIPGARYLFPFMTTPVNIAKFGLERTPLKAFDIVRKASKGGLRGGELSDDLSKLGTSIAMTWWIGSEVAAKNITGTGPVEPAERRTLLQAGWAPLSVKVGDRWFSYKRIEPFATSIGIIADGTELIQSALDAEVIDADKAQELIEGTFALVLKNISDKTFLQSVGQLSDVLHDPARYGEDFIEGRAGSTVPAFVAQIVRSEDPNLRNVRGAFEAIQSRLPALGDFSGREGLYPIRNMFGDPVEQTGNFWFRWMPVPIAVKEISASPAAIMLKDRAFHFSRLERTISIEGTGVKIDLSDAEYDKYQILAGRHTLRLLAGIVDGLGNVPDDLAEKQVRGIVNKSKALARKQLLEERRVLKEFETKAQGIGVR